MTKTTLLSPLQKLAHPLFEKHGVDVHVKRDDLIHPIISGNKWRKLKYQILEAKRSNIAGIVSFGGSFSNHIHALAFACQQQGLKSVGIIRGEPSNASNYTLSCAQKWGMTLDFVDRQTYRLRHDNKYITALAQKYPDYLIVPEGGSAHLAIPGVSECIDEINAELNVDTLLVPVGSGGTIAGLISGAKDSQQILGIAVMKNAEYLMADIKSLVGKKNLVNKNWQLMTQYHCGGYAKFSADDLLRMQDFMKATGIPLEPIYSGKMILALLSLLEQGFFPVGHRIVLIHTGGLQGLNGLAARQLISSDHWPAPT